MSVFKTHESFFIMVLWQFIALILITNIYISVVNYLYIVHDSIFVLPLIYADLNKF